MLCPTSTISSTAYPAGDPIRSSAALGGSPDVEGGIVYFGCGNGRVFALHARDGTRRWSFDTTASDPELADRNDLNGSVALGRTGLYLGSESGRVWYVPYDWCLHARDPRCRTDPAADPSREKASLVYVTPGHEPSLCAAELTDTGRRALAEHRDMQAVAR